MNVTKFILPYPFVKTLCCFPLIMLGDRKTEGAKELQLMQTFLLIWQLIKELILDWFQRKS